MRTLIKLVLIPSILVCYLIGFIAKLIWEFLITGWGLGERFTQWLLEEAEWRRDLDSVNSLSSKIRQSNH